MLEVETRRCVRCGTHRPIDRFSRYSAQRETRRRVCQPCATLERDVWLATQPKAYQDEYFERMRLAGKARDRRYIAQRADALEERRENITGMLLGLRARGWTDTEIARRTGMNRATVKRYANRDYPRWTKREIEQRLIDFLVNER